MRANRNSGFSLLGVLVALGVAGALVVLLDKVLTNSMQGTASFSAKTDRTFIAQYVSERLSCEESNIYSCSPGQPVVLRDSNDNVLIKSRPATPTRFGKFAVRAICAKDGQGAILTAARLRPGKSANSTAKSDYLPDPLTKQTVRFSDNSASLLPSGIAMCTQTKNRLDCLSVSKSGNPSTTNGIQGTCPEDFTVVSCSGNCKGVTNDDDIFIYQANDPTPPGITPNGCYYEDKNCSSTGTPVIRVRATCCRVP